MADVESPKPELPKPEVADSNPAQPAETPDSKVVETSKPLAGLFGKLFKRNGRHPKDCQCPLHRPVNSGSVFDPPVLSNDVSVETSFAPPIVPINPARFEVWGRLVSRCVKTVFRFLTAETPAKAKKVFGEVEGAELVKDLVILPEELADLESSATRLAAKYNLTTGYDEELEFVITAGSIFGRVILVNRKLDAALAKLNATATGSETSA